MMKLNGKVALITGAASGIVCDCAQRLARPSHPDWFRTCAISAVLQLSRSISSNGATGRRERGIRSRVIVG